MENFDVKKSNEIITHLKKLESKDPVKIMSALSTLEVTFTNLLKTGKIKEEKELKLVSQGAKAVYYKWIHDRYIQFLGYLLMLLSKSSRKVQERSLTVSVKLIEEEAPVVRQRACYQLRNLLQHLLDSDTVIPREVVRAVREFLSHQDAVHFTLKYVAAIMKKQRGEHLKTPFVNNLLSLMEQINFPEFIEPSTFIFVKKCENEDADMEEFEKMLQEILDEPRPVRRKREALPDLYEEEECEYLKTFLPINRKKLKEDEKDEDEEEEQKYVDDSDEELEKNAAKRESENTETEVVAVENENAKRKGKPLSSCKPTSALERHLKKNFNAIWNPLVRHPMTDDQLKRCLIVLSNRALQHLYDPLSLADFFIESFDKGGAISLMALNGIFIMMTEHYLDYPEFYTKVYSLLEPTVFQAKYKARFFYLLDLFLKSTYVPEYIPAAFLKRLSRLLLVAPSHCLVLMLKFISNILYRFPMLDKMVHNPHVKDIASDPFIETEPNPRLSKASESSLWEVKTLVYHPLPQVNKETKVIYKQTIGSERNIYQNLEDDYEMLYETSIKEKENGLSTMIEAPTSLFTYRGNKVSHMWCIT